MDIAWPALATLVVLMPGFFFYVGLYSRELYGRDASSKDALSKLAPIVIVAFFGHAILIVAVGFVPFLPRVDFGVFLTCTQS